MKRFAILLLGCICGALLAPIIIDAWARLVGSRMVEMRPLPYRCDGGEK